MATGGEVRGMDQALLQLMRAYKPSTNGQGGVNDLCIITLPVERWAEYSWSQDGDASLTAGQSSIETLFTIPLDERATLLAVTLERTGGDMAIRGISVLVPGGYQGGGGDGRIHLTFLATDSTQFAYWPHGAQSVNLATPGPLPLEPGTQIDLQPSGAGASVSTVNYKLMMTRSKIIHSTVPYPS